MNNLINGVKITPLKKISDERGMVLHLMKNNSHIFKKFGEVYFSITNPGVIKGWKKHLEMTQNFSVPSGKIKIVLYDGREKSLSYGKVNILFLSLEDYRLLTIPPEIWYSFKTVSNSPSMIANFASIPHSATEVSLKEIDTNDIPYTWE